MRKIVLLILVLSSVSLLRASTPDTIPGLFSLSFQKSREGDLRAALNAVYQILQKEPKNYTANLRASWLLYSLKRYSQSETRYRKTVDIAPRAIEPRLGLLLPLMAQRKWAQVEEIIVNLLKYDPLNYTLNSRFAYVLFVTGRYGAALKYYNKVLVLYPSDLDMQLGMGWTQLKMGNNLEASRWFQAVLNVMPTNTSARAGLNALQPKVARR